MSDAEKLERVIEIVRRVERLREELRTAEAELFAVALTVKLDREPVRA